MDRRRCEWMGWAWVAGAMVGAMGCNTTPGADAGVCDLSAVVPVTKSRGPTSSETWPSGVYLVTDSFKVPVGVTLTIDACNRIELSPDVTLTVDGALVVAGTSGRPVSFERATPASPWGAIYLDSGGTAELAYATLTGGGGLTAMATSDTLGAPLYVRGSGGPPLSTPIKVSHVDIVGSTGLGAALINAGFAAGSTALTVSGSGSHPLYLGAQALGTVPDGRYTDNGVDSIVLQSAYYAVQANTEAITADLTIRNLGVPYDVGLSTSDSITIGADGSTTPLVTIEPGVTIRFTRGASHGGQLVVKGDGPGAVAYGAVRAVGTASQPIVFTSAEASPAAGDWIGLRFVGVDSRTRLEQVQIAYAGADSSTTGACVTVNGAFDADAALQIFSASAPSEFLVNSSITDCAGNGIYRGWTGVAVDFLSTNSLTRVAWCAETLVRDPTSGCPKTSCPSAP